MRRIAILSLSAVVSLTASVRAEAPRLEKLLPSGEVAADVMALVAPARAVELSRRIAEAVARNEDWVREQMAKVAPGEPLPYDARLGVSEAEYRELQQLADAMNLQKTAQVRLRFRPKAEGAYEIEAPGVPDLAGITLELKEDRVRTPFGTLTPSEAIDNSDEKSPAGPWSGTQWGLEQAGGDGKSGVTAKLAIGRLSRDGRGILYYTAKETRDGGLVRKADAILFYTLAPP